MNCNFFVALLERQVTDNYSHVQHLDCLERLGVQSCPKQCRAHDNNSRGRLTQGPNCLGGMYGGAHSAQGQDV